MENPLISVIVPIYNAEQTLHRCVDSILQQSYTHFELLLVDDGSVDCSGTICDQYKTLDSRVRVFHKTNGGVSSARNLALDNVCGAYITFCDSDDYVGKDWLSNFENGFLTHSDLSIQGFTLIDHNGVTSTTHEKLGQFSSCTTVQDLIVSLMSHGLYGFLWVKLFKAKTINDFHLRFDENSRFREDEQFLSQYLQHSTSFNIVNKEGYIYFLPAPKKNYKGNSYYSLPYIFKSLDIIFDGKLPKEICDLHYVNIKDMIVSELLGKRVPDDYVLDLFGRVVMMSYNKKKGFRNLFLYFLVKKCNYFSPIFYPFLKIIHNL